MNTIKESINIAEFMAITENGVNNIANMLTTMTNSTSNPDVVIMVVAQAINTYLEKASKICREGMEKINEKTNN